MPFVSVAEPPPLNAQYVPAFNALAEFCGKRGWPVEAKEIDDPLDQSDLDLVRAAVMAALPGYINLEAPRPVDPEADCDLPFEPLLLNEGKGFLMMPGLYTSTGEPLYSPEPEFPDSVPVLWEHFADLAEIMNSMTAGKADHYYTLRLQGNTAEVAVSFPGRPDDLVEEHETVWDQERKRLVDRWQITYSGNPEAPASAAACYYYYHLLPCGDADIVWTLLPVDIPPENRGRVDFAFLGSAGPLIEALNDPQVDACHLQAVLFYDDVIDVMQPEFQPDSQTNDVVFEGGCEACQGGKCSNSRDMVASGIGSRRGQMGEMLALSAPGATGLAVRHRMSPFTFAGNDYGQYNCDTRIEEEFSGSAEDENGETVSWSFSYLRRPGGALIPFCWQTDDGQTVGTPLNGCSYRMFHSDGGTEVRYADGVSHILSGNVLSKCRHTFNPDLEVELPGEEVDREARSGTQYFFDSPAVGPLLLTVDAKAFPVDCVPLQPALRSKRALSAEDPGRIAMSSGSTDVTGFGVEDFFPAGEAPELGGLVKCTVADFYDALDQLKSKYIERDYEDGAVAKGFWSREGGVLEPMELALYRLETDPEDAALLTERKTHVKYSSNGRNQSESRTLRRSFPFGERIVAQYRRYGTPGELVTTYEYGTDPTQGGYGELTFSSDFNGTWRKNVYDDYGRLIKDVKPWLDSAHTDDDGQCDVTTYDYTRLDAAEVTESNDPRARTVIRRVLGTEVSRSYHLYFAFEARSIQAAAPGASHTAAGNLVSKSYRYAEGEFAGRHWKRENADGSSSVTTYETAADGGLVTTTESGRLPNHGTREVTTANRRGLIVSRRRYDIASGLLIGGSDSTYDDYGRRLTETTVDGDVTTTEYNCCGPRFVTAPDGGVTEYAYDVFNRVRFSSRAGVTTLQSYDADDNVVETTLLGKEGGELTTTSEYDADGELIFSTDPAGATTAHTYGERWEEITNALGHTSRTNYYIDGRTKSISGTAVAARSYTYGVSSGQLYEREALTNDEWVQRYTDFLGRQFKSQNAAGFTQTVYFDNFSRAERTETSLGSKSLTVYDPATGKVKYSVRKRTPGNTVDFTADTVGEMQDDYEEIDGKVFHVSRTFQYVDGQPIEVAKNVASRDGKTNFQTRNGLISSRTVAFEGGGAVTAVAVSPDGTTQTEYRVDGLTERAIHSVLGEVAYVYDEFNRPTGNDYEAAGVLHELRNTLDAAGRVIAATETAGPKTRTTAYVYDLLGRKLALTTPGGLTTSYTYNSRGQTLTVTGGTYPVTFAYNAQGRLATLTTYQDAETPAVTTFTCDSYGRLSQKNYADGQEEIYAYRADGSLLSQTNARNQTISLDYNMAGEITSMSAASGLSRVFTYDQNGLRTRVTEGSAKYLFTYDVYGHPLSETSPQVPGLPVRRCYDALQRLSELRLGEAGRTFLCFNDDPIRGVRRINETPDSFKMEFAMGPWEDRADLAYQPINTVFPYNGTNYDDFGRPEGDTGFGKHKERLAPYLIDRTAEGVFVQYRYGADGRLRQTVTPGGIQTIDYLAGTNLASSRTWRPESGRLQHVACDYDETLRLTAITRNGLPVVGYTLNERDQRTRTELPDGSAWDYTYDDLGQLLTAERGAVNAMAYTYDTIGNRLTALEDGAATEYTANLLNQYTAIDAEVPTYDADGNMLTNGDWTYAWDIENRLISAESGDLRMEAVYDFMSRRREKKVYTAGTLTSHQHFLYDNFKLIAICDALNNNKITTTFTWQPTGPDVPLTMTHAGETCYYITDGNKNVLQLLRPNGTFAAAYTYGPFGQTLSAAGPWAELNPFRFSSEYHDDETDLVYYNYRYYSPQLGRWLSRDPLGEIASDNDYGFVLNNMVSATDFLGLWLDLPAGYDKTKKIPFFTKLNSSHEKMYIDIALYIGANNNLEAGEAAWKFAGSFWGNNFVKEAASGLFSAWFEAATGLINSRLVQLGITSLEIAADLWSGTPEDRRAALKKALQEGLSQGKITLKWDDLGIPKPADGAPDEAFSQAVDKVLDKYFPRSGFGKCYLENYRYFGKGMFGTVRICNDYFNQIIDVHMLGRSQCRNSKDNPEGDYPEWFTFEYWFYARYSPDAVNDTINFNSDGFDDGYLYACKCW